MHKVEMMSQMPSTCLHCGRGNTPDEPDTIDEFWALDLERDVNWGDSTYICKYCVDQLAAVAGFVTMEQLDEVTRQVDDMRVKLHEKAAEHDSYRRRVQATLLGRKAEEALQKDAQQSAQSKPKKKAKKAKTPQKRAA